MKKILFFVIVFLILGLNVSAETVSSGIDDQTSVEVTAYNNNLGLIKDTRNVTLPEGEGELMFMDVASYIMPVTVYVKSVNQPDDFVVLEQNYEYDLMNADKLLDKYVGKTIKIVDWNEYQDRKETVSAELLSNNQGQIYKINDEIYLGHPGYKVLPKIPDNLIAKPTLMWQFENKSDNTHELEVSYLTSNISWEADYVLILDEGDILGDLSGWVTLNNKSGAAYRDAKLKLVAGEVHRAGGKGMYMDEIRMMKSEARAPQFEKKAFFEYHIYDLQRKTTIKNNQTKQISLLTVPGIKLEKELLVYGVKTWFTRSYNEDMPKQPVNVYIKFKNAKDNNLGMPLPAGVIRMYKEDSDNSQQFIGEDRIDHTPKDEEIKLMVGEAFDVVAERKQTDYKAISTRLHETSWEITLRNHKEEEIEVGVIEPLYGNWQVMQSSQPYEKVDAFTIRFNVKVSKDAEIKITYTVRVGL